jgi:threonine dehydratase
MASSHPPIDYLERVLNAQVYDVAIETPLELARTLSDRVGNHVYLKREDLQSVFSFKLRGAYNKIAKLSEEAKKHGVICASAGNHAQGVALAAHKLGLRAVVVMPVTTPQIKIDAVKRLGGEVVLSGESYSDAYAHALTLQQAQHLAFVHPYDDPDVIAGQGTVAMEILRHPLRPIHAIFCPVGGGGLISGIAAYVKRLRPEIRVFGVEAIDSDAMTRSLAAGHRITLEQVGLFADGTAVKQVGLETFRHCQTLIDGMVVVDNDAICAAIKDVFEDTRCILEPAGALSIAGAKQHAAHHAWRDKNLVCIASGANMNFDRLRFVAERAELGEQREAVLAVTIPERPGSFKEFCDVIGNRNITEFNYRYADPSEAHIFVGVAIHKRQEATDLVASLSHQGLPSLDLTDDEMAKDHVRYMVGGRSGMAEHERLFRFTFPERPGALGHFLSNLRSNWNISLFHYRNHGSDYGRVLVGMQVPPNEEAEFRDFLERVHYPFVEETMNPAYRLFLR